MTTFDPSFQVVTLDQAPVGALVIFESAPAFVAVNPSAPSVVKSIVKYDKAARQFVYRYFEAGVPRVLLPDQDKLVTRPKLKSFALDVNLAPPSDQLFVDQSERFIVVSIPTGNQTRLLSLVSGHLVMPTTTQKDAFSAWEIVIASRGEILPLLAI